MYELADYLNAEYPKTGKLYVLLRVAFMNDYHRKCRDEMLALVSQHDREMAGNLMMAKLIGGAIYTAYDWVRAIDHTLFNLLNNKENRIFFRNYLRVEDLELSSKKVSDIIHGEGYSERLKESVRRAIASR